MYDPYDPYDPHNPHNEPWADGLSFDEVEMIENNTVTDRDASLAAKAKTMGVNSLSDAELAEITGTNLAGLSKKAHTEQMMRAPEPVPDIVPAESISVSDSGYMAKEYSHHNCDISSSGGYINSSFELIKEMELTTGEFLMWLKTEYPQRYAVSLMDKKGLVEGWDGEPMFDSHRSYDFAIKKCGQCGIYVLSFVG